ncbi:MAG TPA: universal stress protein [Bacteroidota bacterium]|nr:universal stress protein [Bacteroidota bacterium]
MKASRRTPTKRRAASRPNPRTVSKHKVAQSAASKRTKPARMPLKGASVKGTTPKKGAAEGAAPKRVRIRRTVPAQGSPISNLGIRSILVPIDFSVHSKNALKYAVPMARQFGASLHLVYVVEPTIYPADLGFGQVVLPGVEEELRQKGAQELQVLIEREIGDRVPATSSVRTGNPHHEILNEAEEKNVDLIIVATHGHSGVEHMLFGSTADRIVRHARCPVLTIRPVA